MGEQSRLDILLEGQVISLAVKEITEKFIQELEKEYSLDLTSNTGTMFVTHLAMALKRMSDGSSLDKIPDQVKEELEDSIEIINKTNDIIEGLNQDNKMSLAITDDEVYMISAYVKTLM